MSERTVPTLEEVAALADTGSAYGIVNIVAELAAVLIVHNRRLDALEVGRSGDGAAGIDWKFEYTGALNRLVERTQERDAARADVERLRTWLTERGKWAHDNDCPVNRDYIHDPVKPCTCGLADALKETP